MTLNKVPNTDDLDRNTILWERGWTWAGNNGGGQDPVQYYEDGTTTISYLDKHAVLNTSGSDGDRAKATHSALPHTPGAGKLVTYIGWGLNTDFSNLSNWYEIGHTRNSRNGSDITVLNPEATRFRVKIGSSTTHNKDVSGAMTKTKPGTGVGVHYHMATVHDYDNSKTELYLDKNPFTDTADATVDDVTGKPQSPSAVIYGPSSGGSSSEELYATYGKMIYVL